MNNTTVFFLLNGYFGSTSILQSRQYFISNLIVMDHYKVIGNGYYSKNRLREKRYGVGPITD